MGAVGVAEAVDARAAPVASTRVSATLRRIVRWVWLLRFMIFPFLLPVRAVVSRRAAGTGVGEVGVPAGGSSLSARRPCRGWWLGGAAGDRKPRGRGRRSRR